MRLIFEKHISRRKPPINIRNEDVWLFEHEFEKKIRSTSLIKILNGILLDDLIIQFGHSFRQYLAYSFVNPSISIKGIVRRVLLFRRGIKTIEKGVWIIDDWSIGYFHWLTDALPRLLASRGDGEYYPVILPNHYKQYNYINESLSLLNEQILYYNPRIPLRIKFFLIVSHTAETGNYNHVLINELRNKFLSGFETGGVRKIFISRLKAARRKIVNENEVVALLELYGYEIHYFEDYEFKKQIELIAQSKSLIGLHGAGLTNMLFMREGSKVLELRNRNDAHNNCFFSLASELNLNYYYQLNEGNKSDTLSVDINVNIDELRKNVERMECSSST